MRQGCKIIKIGTSSAIICGGEPTDHTCNDKGETIYGFDDGFSGTLFEKAKLEKLNLNMCDDDKLYFLREKGITTTSASVSCSICGRVAIDNAYWL
jgi:hypothetical protein